MKKLLILVFCSMVAVSSAYSGDLELETIGALGGANLYLSYMAIGAVADGYTKKVYDKKTAKGMIAEVVSISNVSKDYLKKLIDQGVLTGNDVDFANTMIETYDYLIAEGTAFSKYVDNPQKNFSDDFHSNRNLAWGKISQLLGLNK
ncbi:MAG TPA: hypothetical protein DHW82_04545 [Spirochaetia bacterium]|nr:hypothetical protein [Spirochaetia bacterium]